MDTKYYVINSLSRRARVFFSEAHRSTNHMYGKGANEETYDYHTEHVADVARRFMHCTNFSNDEIEITIAGCYGHDSVSDARITYNDINNSLRSSRLAKVCCNLCEDMHGTNREERNSPSYYERITSDEISAYIKICDRIANIERGLWEGSSMCVKYYHERLKFFIGVVVYSINDVDSPKFNSAWSHLNELYEDVKRTNNLG